MEKKNIKVDSTNPSIARLDAETGGKPITIIGNEKIRDGFDELCIQQAVNSRKAPGVDEVVLNPDAHAGYGAPVGCAMSSRTHLYPGPVGFDIKCSMSLLQLDVPKEEIADKKTRRAIINAICERIPTGMGKGGRHVSKAREVDDELMDQVVTAGASHYVLDNLGIPTEWAQRCEDSRHGSELDDRMGWDLLEYWEYLYETDLYNKLKTKFNQLGSLGGGNHFLEANVVSLVGEDATSALAHGTFGLKDGHVATLTHCGSRGFGHVLADKHFKKLEDHFKKWGIPFPGNDKQLVYAPVKSDEGQEYLADMSLGANFATVNHMLINALVLEAFQEVLPGTTGNLVYYISHNIARQEIIDNKPTWVHRKGATRAFPANHHALKSTPFYLTGHPILLPGNPAEGSVVMVAQDGAKDALYSVNHGAGRALGRKQAFRVLDQAETDKKLEDLDIMTNCRQYPLDESPDAYKDFNEVISSVEEANLAKTIAKLSPSGGFVIKDSES